MEEAAGRRGLGWERALVVPSCPVRVLPDRGAVPGHKATEKKGKRDKRGVQIQARDRGSLGGVGPVYMSVCVCSVTAHAVVHSPPLFSHTGTDVPLASDIFICSEQSQLREGDPRDAPEQILTSSIRSL